MHHGHFIAYSPHPAWSQDDEFVQPSLSSSSEAGYQSSHLAKTCINVRIRVKVIGSEDKDRIRWDIQLFALSFWSFAKDELTKFSWFATRRNQQIRKHNIGWIWEGVEVIDSELRPLKRIKLAWTPFSAIVFIKLLTRMLCNCNQKTSINHYVSN